MSAGNTDALTTIAGIAAERDVDAMASAFLAAVTQLIPCEHASYNEADPFLGATRTIWSDPSLNQGLETDDSWLALLAQHPLINHYIARPQDRPLRLSDVTDITAFHQGALYSEVMRPTATDHQLILYLGNLPGVDPANGGKPLAVGVALNRQSRNFSAQEKALAGLFVDLARPLFRLRRAEQLGRALDGSAPSTEIRRLFRSLGVTERQAEVALWVARGKSNSEIAEIMGVAPQTVRQHTIRLFEQMGVEGRQGVLRAFYRSILS